METDILLEALTDFEKQEKKDMCPVLEQLLGHIAKTGQTMVPWGRFKSYFLFKLERVMDDFRASVPEQRGVTNPNVESVPFEEMKARIMKIVNGYNGIPFTIQRLCELMTEPRRNYSGTEKFLRGVEKNVMVVSCVHPTSEKNGCGGLNRVNGVMLPGNTSIFTERKVNGPGTPRPLPRPKPLSPSATNGLPDSTENTEPTAHTHSPLSGAMKNKHHDEDDGMEEAQQEVKRLKFHKDGGEEEEEEEEEDEEEEEEEEEEQLRPTHTPRAVEMEDRHTPSSDQHEEEEEQQQEAASTARASEEPSVLQSDCPPGSHDNTAEREVPCASDPTHDPSDMDQSEQRLPAGEREGEGLEGGEPISSSSSSEDSPACSTTDLPTEGAIEPDTQDSAEEPMEQD